MKSKKKIVSLIFAITFAFSAVVLISGCGRRVTIEPSKAGVFTIVASFYPIYIETLNVAGGVEGVNVVNMAKLATGCLHDYQLSTNDLKTLEKADVFVINGAGMEAFMNKVTNQLPKLESIDSSSGIKLIKDATGIDNAHVWVSVSNSIMQVQNIEKGLEKADPAHADVYSSNASAYISKLESLKQEMHSTLDNLKTKNIITFHEAFPYFAAEFGLKIDAVIEREPGTAPTPAELEATIKIVKRTGCKVLFTEPQYPVGAAKTIATETGAKIYSLDPAATGAISPNAYIDIMEQNLKSLKEALS
jgi:zinc transport system substrate-binding protein